MEWIPFQEGVAQQKQLPSTSGCIWKALRAVHSVWVQSIYCEIEHYQYRYTTKKNAVHARADSWGVRTGGGGRSFAAGSPPAPATATIRGDDVANRTASSAPAPTPTTTPSHYTPPSHPDRSNGVASACGRPVAPAGGCSGRRAPADDAHAAVPGDSGEADGRAQVLVTSLSPPSHL